MGLNRELLRYHLLPLILSQIIMYHFMQLLAYVEVNEISGALWPQSQPHYSLCSFGYNEWLVLICYEIIVLLTGC